jgi:hypothetical protein
MKVSKSFVKIYNETFKFIAEKLGKESVEEYWLRIAPLILWDLDKAVNKKGLFGAWEYWSDVLQGEGAFYEMDIEDGVFKLNIFRCPSLKALEKPYEHYCDHCRIMYEPIFKKHGFNYSIKRNGKGCQITISRTSKVAN